MTQAERITQLEARIAALEARIATLEFKPPAPITITYPPNQTQPFITPLVPYNVSETVHVDA